MKTKNFDLNNGIISPFLQLNIQSWILQYLTRIYDSLSCTRYLSEYKSLIIGIICSLFISSASFGQVTPAEPYTFPYVTIKNLVHFCDRDSKGVIEFHLNGEPSDYTFQWLHGPTSLNISVDEPGTYTLNVTNKYGCTQRYDVKVLLLNHCEVTTELLNVKGRCRKLIRLTVTSGDITDDGAVLDAAALDIVWDDGEVTGLERNVGVFLTDKTYCVTITPKSGSALPCCEVATCVTIPGDIKCDQLRPVIVTEIERSKNGANQYVELLVLGNRECATTFDLRGFILDDNDGRLIKANNFVNANNKQDIGIDAGYLMFSNSENWDEVPVGSLILIYDEQGQDHLPTDDPTDSNQDGVYVLAANNTDYLRASSGVWDAINSNMKYEGGYLVSPTWALIKQQESADAMQVLTPEGNYVHGVSLGSNSYCATNDFSLWLTDNAIEVSNSSLVLTDYLDKAHFANKGIDDDARTPGAANSPENQALIDTLRYCLDTSGYKPAALMMQSPTNIQYSEHQLSIFPNPFNYAVTVRFQTSLDGPVKLNILSVTGQILQQVSWNASKGDNEYTLIRDESIASGLLIFEFSFPDASIENKRIMLIR